jgi:hypothetical protein
MVRRLGAGCRPAEDHETMRIDEWHRVGEPAGRRLESPKSQVVEGSLANLAKVGVAGSNPVVRSDEGRSGPRFVPG